jgi:plasmid stabilization system protein ParE
MRVVATSEALAQLENRKKWWRENRPATADLFDQEFLDAVALISERPELFPSYRKIGDTGIRRVLMEKTACHLYYEVDEEAGVVRILSAWAAVRGMPPSLKK